MKILLATIQSHKHISGDIARGIKMYKKGGIKITEKDGEYTAIVPQQNGDSKKATLRFSRNKCDIEYNNCQCVQRHKSPALCRHVIAAILEIQGGIIESPLTLGKTASATIIANESDTAEEIGSGSLPVYATPAMIALMEKAACNCLNNGLEDGQTSVGTKIDVEHIAASKIGATITAEARIEKIFGKIVEFSVIAYGNENRIGMGHHTRVIVDENKFMERMRNN